MSVGYKDAVFIAEGSPLYSRCVYQYRQTCTGCQDDVQSNYYDSCNTGYLADSGLLMCI